MKTYVLGLCYNRHPAPVKEAIFTTDISFKGGVSKLEEVANERIPSDCARLAIYVSGCTIAMMAVVAVCIRRKIKLTAYHLNIEKGGYERQDVLL